MAEGENKKKFIPLKIITLGSASTGKTSILLRYTTNEFNDNVSATLGIDYKQKVIQYEGNSIKLSIWDSCGQEQFKGVVKNYFKLVSGVILVFDLSNLQSFQDLTYWIKALKEEVDLKDIGLVLVGNKSDIRNRQVTKSTILPLKEELGCKYYCVSAKTGEGIIECFQGLIQEILKKRETLQKNDDKKGDVKLSDKELLEEEENKKKCC